jgi:hypothetical protein
MATKKNVRTKPKVKAVAKAKTCDDNKIPSTAEMERRARAYREAGRLRALALTNVNKARDVLTRTEKALDTAPLGAGRGDGTNAAGDPLCAAHFNAEDYFFDAVTELALASKSYRKAFVKFVLAPEAAGSPQ